MQVEATASLARVEAGPLIRSWVMTKRPRDWNGPSRTDGCWTSSTLRMVQASQPPPCLILLLGMQSAKKCALERLRSYSSYV